MQPTEEEMAAMSGENAYGNNQEKVEVSLNGDNGRFTLFDRTAEKDPKTGKYKKEPLDAGLTLKFDENTGEKEIIGVKPLKVVFLKIRRALSYYHPEGGSMRTTEHNTKYDTVILYGPEKGDKKNGIADALRTAYPQLRTVQKVYAYLPERQEVVRVIIKGSSLGSQKEVPGVKKFYDYIGSFKKPDHFYNYITEIVPVTEDGPKGPYYPMSFVRGEKLTDEQQVKMNSLMASIHAETQASDALVAQRIAAASSGTPADLDIQAEDFPDIQADSSIEYPSEEINPEDIPF